MSLSSQFQLASKLGLYVVTTSYNNRTHLDIARGAIKGGAKIIQYRNKDASSRILLKEALELRDITAKENVLFIINDRLDIALAAGADGVHLGQDDLPYEAAREILGNKYIIGISATNLEEALEAAGKGADYIGLGPIFPTPSKDDAASPIGLEGLKATRSATDVPIVAIGGITSNNIEEVVAAGSDAIALISAVAAAPDMVAASRELAAKIERARQNRGA